MQVISLEKIKINKLIREMRSKMIPKKYQKITFTILMGMSMAFSITSINMLLTILTGTPVTWSMLQAFPFIWLRSTLIATPVAYFIVPPLQRLTEKLIKSDSIFERN